MINTYPHSYKDLAKLSGLKENYIRRVMGAAPELRDRYSIKGSNNAIRFSGDALAFLVEVANYKAKDWSLSDTIKSLVRDLSEPDKSLLVSQGKPVRPESFTSPDYVIQSLTASHDKVIASHERILEAKEETLREKEARISDLKHQLLLLTDGKSPEQIQQERKTEAERLAKLEQERIAAQQLAEEKSNQVKDQARLLERQREQIESQAKADQERSLKRAALLDKLGRLSWYQWGQRRDLLEQIRGLE